MSTLGTGPVCLGSLDPLDSWRMRGQPGTKQVNERDQPGRLTTLLTASGLRKLAVG